MRGLCVLYNAEEGGWQRRACWWCLRSADGAWIDGDPGRLTGGYSRLACRYGSRGGGGRSPACTGGGLMVAMTDSDVPEDDANLYAEGVRRGATIRHAIRNPLPLSCRHAAGASRFH